MWHWRQLTHAARALIRGEESGRELSDEVRDFLDRAEADLVAAGATSQEARRTTRLRYGSSIGAREDVRAQGWEAGAEDLYADLRLAARRLRRTPAFAGVVILIVGVGIGSTTAILSAVNQVLFQPLPYPDADRIVAISDRAGDGSPLPVTFGTYLELSARARSFQDLSVFKPWQPTLTGGEEPERLQGQRVSANYFQTLGVAPLGRGFAPSSDRSGGPDEVILSDGLWRARFAADPAIIGRTVDLDSEPYLVVGIMPASFQNATRCGARLWALLQYDRGVTSFDTREWGHHLRMVGRLGAGSSLGAARQQLDNIAEQTLPEFSRPPWASMTQGLAVQRLRDAATAAARPTSLVLLGAVGLLLAVSCVNLTVLLLAQGSRRGEELSIRAALGAGLLVRSMEHLFSIPLGFHPSSIVVMQVHTTGLGAEDTATHRFWNQTLEQVRQVPGVRAATLTSQLPLSGDLDTYGVTVDDTNREIASGGAAYRYAVSPGYFATMGIGVLQGRALEPTDRSSSTRVAVVSDSLARRLFPSRDPLGQRIYFGPTEPPPYTIVGVVEDVRQESLEAEDADAVYTTSEQWHWADRDRWIVVQAERDPLDVVPAVRRVVWSVDNRQPIVRIQTLPDLVLHSESQRRFVMSVLGVFSSLALALAALGLYGILSASVADRRPEIGVRMALGASPRSILALVIRQGMTVTSIGAAIGLAGGALASEFLATFIFGVSRLDLITYAGAIAILASVTAVACWLPARRASHTDPLATLRAD